MAAGSQHPLSADPGAWIPAEALFLLERRGWEAEMRLGSWENSVSGFITSRTKEKGTCAKRGRRGGRTLESQGARATEIFLLCHVRGPQYVEAPGPCHWV